jgi:hypothetical protein
VTWTWTRIGIAIAVAAALAIVAFLFRFNPLGGTLGGFDNDHFVHLVRTDLLMRGEQPLRDFADAELRGAWPSLGYELSAWAQQVWGRTLLAEAYLTVGALALCAAGVFLLALHLSGRWVVALLAAACVIVAEPKLYNYEKLLVLFVALLLVRLWILKPSWPLLAALSAWTAIAALVRHDFAVYVAIAAGAALVARGPAPVTWRAGRLAAYAAIAVVLLIPSIVWVDTYEGLRQYAQRTLESVRAESLRTELEEWPALDPAEGLGRDNMIAVAYYVFWAIPLAGAVRLGVLLVRRRGLEPAVLPTGLALVGCAMAANAFFLRGNLLARFGDAIVPLVLLAAWMAAAGHVRPAHSKAAVPLRLVPHALLAVLLAALFAGGDMRAELQATGLSDSWEQTEKRFRAAHAGLTRMPPDVWTAELLQWLPPASQYLAECTGPDDRVLLATYAPEVPVLARRLVAAGQGTFGLAFYESESQQLEAVSRLRRQSVPVVLGSYEDFEGEFVSDYRHVSEYVAARYHEAGAIAGEDRPRFRVLVASDREPRRVHPDFNLPCFR